MISLNGKPINITRFPDGTSQVWKLPAVDLEAEAAHVFWHFESEAEVMHLAQLALLLLHRGPRARYLTIGFLPYGRQDKLIANDATFGLWAFAPILNGMHWKKVIICDPHSATATELIAGSSAVYYTGQAIDCLRAISGDLFCFPDTGALAKYGPLFEGHPSVAAEKVRNQSTGRVETGKILGDVRGKRVLIVDDICDGGATFIGLAAKLRESGAADVALFVSHGLFTRGVKALTDAGISRVFTPNGEVFP